MKRIFTWASVIAVTLVLSPSNSPGQMSDDYGFPIETRSDSERQCNVNANRGPGLVGRGFFRSRTNLNSTMNRGYSTVPQYLQWAQKSSILIPLGHRNYSYKRSDRTWIAPPGDGTVAQTGQRDSKTTIRAANKAVAIASSRQCAANR